MHRPQLTGRPAKAGQTAPVDDEREVYVGGEWTRCPIHERDNLDPGMQLNGPAVIEEFGSTTVVFPGWRMRVDGYENLVMERAAR